MELQLGHVAFVTASIAAQDLTRGSLVRLGLRPAPRWAVPLAFAYRTRDRDSPIVVALREVIHPRRA